MDNSEDYFCKYFLDIIFLSIKSKFFLLSSINYSFPIYENKIEIEVLALAHFFRARK